MADTMAPVPPNEHYATKADLGLLKSDLVQVEGRLNEKIAQLEGRLNEKIAQVEGRLNEKIAQVEGRLNEKIATLRPELRADLERSIRMMTWQLIGALVVIAGLVVTIMRIWPTG